MAEASDGKAAGGAHFLGHFRASDTDREQVIDTLKTAFVQGRLTKDELDARAGQTFASQTYAQLAKVIADIPAGQAAARERAGTCLLYTSPSPRDRTRSRMPSSA